MRGPLRRQGLRLKMPRSVEAAAVASVGPEIVDDAEIPVGQRATAARIAAPSADDRLPFMDVSSRWVSRPVFWSRARREPARFLFFRYFPHSSIIPLEESTRFGGL